MRAELPNAQAGKFLRHVEGFHSHKSRRTPGAKVHFAAQNLLSSLRGRQNRHTLCPSAPRKQLFLSIQRGPGSVANSVEASFSRHAVVYPLPKKN
jgi:hypothetical protein